MPSLADHQSNLYTKMILMGDSGSGKTGSLTSLVGAGYRLRILDMDNGLETLKQFILRECPEAIGNVEYRTLRDKYKATPAGSQIVGQPRAFVEAYKMLDRWKYDDVDLGDPAGWGPECILVTDSLTLLSDAAYDWAEVLTPPGKRSGERDSRATYGTAQEGVETFLKTITSESFETNVIVIAHVKYIDNEDGSRKGYPTTVGKALSPQVPIYFNTIALCETDRKGQRTIQTAATATIDLKNPKPFEMLPKYALTTGLADFFKVLREPPKVQPKLRRIASQTV
jgi:hypothetical protein